MFLSLAVNYSASSENNHLKYSIPKDAAKVGPLFYKGTDSDFYKYSKKGSLIAKEEIYKNVNI